MTITAVRNPLLGLYHCANDEIGFLRILEIRKQLQDPSKLQIWGPASVGNALEGHFLVSSEGSLD